MLSPNLPPKQSRDIANNFERVSNRTFRGTPLFTCSHTTSGFLINSLIVSSREKVSVECLETRLLSLPGSIDPYSYGKCTRVLSIFSSKSRRKKQIIIFQKMTNCSLKHGVMNSKIELTKKLLRSASRPPTKKPKPASRSAMLYSFLLSAIISL